MKKSAVPGSYKFLAKKKENYMMRALTKVPLWVKFAEVVNIPCEVAGCLRSLVGYLLLVWLIEWPHKVPAILVEACQPFLCFVF